MRLQRLGQNYWESFLPQNQMPKKKSQNPKRLSLSNLPLNLANRFTKNINAFERLNR